MLCAMYGKENLQLQGLVMVIIWKLGLKREREECVIQLLIVTHEERHLSLLVAYIPH